MLFFFLRWTLPPLLSIRRSSSLNILESLQLELRFLFCFKVLLLDVLLRLLCGFSLFRFRQSFRLLFLQTLIRKNERSYYQFMCDFILLRYFLNGRFPVIIGYDALYRSRRTVRFSKRHLIRRNHSSQVFVFPRVDSRIILLSEFLHFLSPQLNYHTLSYLWVHCSILDT